ncbi:MAG: histidine kinase [Erysipelotrichaceae bacterium]
MGLDQLMELVSSVSSKALPIIGVIVLIFIILFIKRLIKLMDSLNDTLEDVQGIIETTDRQLKNLDGPLSTLNNVCETVDNINEVSKNVVRSSLVAIIENFATLKEWALSKMKDNTEVEEENAVNGSEN